MRSPTWMRCWNVSETLVSVHPGPGMFMLKRPEMSEAHHMFGPVGGIPPARSIRSSILRTEWNPEIEANAIASSTVRTCSVPAVSPTEISSYVLLSINPRFMQIPSRSGSVAYEPFMPSYDLGALLKVTAITEARDREHN